MNRYQITFFTQQGRRVHGQPAPLRRIPGMLPSGPDFAKVSG